MCPDIFVWVWSLDRQETFANDFIVVIIDMIVLGIRNGEVYLSKDKILFADVLDECLTWTLIIEAVYD